MGFYLWKPNPDRLVERERGNGAPPTHTHVHLYTHIHTRTGHPEAADAVVGLVHDLDVNPPVAICAVIE